MTWRQRAQRKLTRSERNFRESLRALARSTSRVLFWERRIRYYEAQLKMTDEDYDARRQAGAQRRQTRARGRRRIVV